MRTLCFFILSILTALPASLNAERPAFDDTAAWLARLDAVPGKADPAAGRRVFFHSNLALCSNCHRHSGRGVVLGPDLSLAGRQGTREALLRSILEPHREGGATSFIRAR